MTPPHLPGGNSFDDLRVDIAEAHRIADQISREKRSISVPACEAARFSFLLE